MAYKHHKLNTKHSSLFLPNKSALLTVFLLDNGTIFQAPKLQALELTIMLTPNQPQNPVSEIPLEFKSHLSASLLFKITSFPSSHTYHDY